MFKYKIGPKVRKDAASFVKEASADDPIYKRGFAIGGIPARRTTVAPKPPEANVPIPEASADAPDLNYPDDLQIQAFNDFEAAMLELYKKYMGAPDQ